MDAVKFKPIGSYPIIKDYNMIHLVFYETVEKIPNYKNIISYIK